MQLDDLSVRHDYSNQNVLQRVAVDEHLGNQGGSNEYVLDLFSGDILALAQLEDVLLSVDDLEGAVGQPLAWENENGVSRRGSGAA
jgi:predicted RNA-binding protein associated with RNAse of E/G family